MMFETLENRQHLSANLQFDTLVITGTSGNDRIMVYRQGTRIYVDQGLVGKPGLTRRSFDASAVASLRMYGLGGNDVLVMQKSLMLPLPSIIDGGAGNDYISGASGMQTLIGGDGNDVIVANGGQNLMLGGAGNDRLIANGGENSLYGGDGNDTLTSTQGEDYLNGGAGNDTITGDTFSMIIGGGGTDVITRVSPTAL